MDVIAFAMVLVAQAAFIPNYAWSRSVQPQISVIGDQVKIVTPSGVNQTITVDHVVQPTDIRIEDLTFDGQMDLKILDTRGASQIFYKVYLYSNRDKAYIYSKELSEIPCLKVDAKKKQLVGTCFHVSACENWVERYSISPDGKLSLLERTGTYCEPNGETYQYSDHFKDGRRISSKVKKIAR
ncbi:hypothetical protein K2O51_12540 [Cupriavidus pinatubonensis]|uniref:XAC2610-related protein n=1 Tax=Cupriavidus pinatubonensis TaxID=248026 RepID=UPI001C736ADA|nr:hypothetical protein [Cupriavidus pinatubonensis]QYY31656.1 hypothetical protein K2O51_12540 [Cupriavidus pinatubonensis]